MSGEAEWEKLYDPESKMWGIWWCDPDRGAVGDVYTEAYADMVIAAHTAASEWPKWRQLEAADQANTSEAIRQRDACLKLFSESNLTKTYAQLAAAEALVLRYREALTDLGCVSVSDTPCRDRTDGYEGCTRCAALNLSGNEGASQ